MFSSLVLTLLFILRSQCMLDVEAVKERRVVLQSLTVELQKLQCCYDDEQQQHKQTASSLHHLSELVER